MRPGQTSHTSGVSSRRSACDRCRGQKLRCLRDDANQDRCDRCAKAKAQCMTSPIYHMRNIFSENQDDTSRIPKRKRLGKVSLSAKPVSSSTSMSTAAFPSIIDDSLTNSCSTSSCTIPPVSEAPIASDSCGSGDIDGRDPSRIQSRSEATPGQKNNQRPSCDKHPEEGTQIPRITSLLSCSEPSPQVFQPPDHLPDLGIRDEAIEEQYDFAEELSRINLNLATQLKQMQQPYVTLKTLIVSDQGDLNPEAITPLERILNATRHFLDTLGLMAASIRSSSYLILSNPLEVPTANNGDQSSGASTLNPQHDSGQSSDSSHSSLPPNDSNTYKQQDNALLLLVLICYIHVLRLHVALFAHIELYLQMISESDERIINPLPRLVGFSTIPLQSGNLQASMIIQLVFNMFEKMESLLGLPREFRIGDREDDQNGLFKSDGFREVAKSMIQKEGVGWPEAGKGGMKSLRENMRKAKHLLRTRAAP